MIWSRALLLLLCMAVLPWAPSGVLVAQNDDDMGGANDERPRVAHVTYLTASTAYIDMGTADGLREGDRFGIVRDGEVIAVLTVSFLSSARASCAIEDGSLGVQVGDEARVLPRREEAEPAFEPPPRPTGRRPGIRGLGLRGRVAVRYQYVRDVAFQDTTFQQPALDLFLEGRNVGGSAFDLGVDIRARRSYRSSPTSDFENSDTRIYRLAGSWKTLNQQFRITFGRQFAATLATVSLFDGVSADYNRPRWSVGGFVGTQPDEIDFGFNSTLREGGAYFQYRNALGSRRRWSVTTGLIGSYTEDEINREFLYLQGQYNDRHLFVYLAQEVDINRGWRALAEDSSLSSTSTFVNLRYRPLKRLTLLAGYDNRRNPRLYRDLVTPETEFDDRHRQGVWAGADIEHKILRAGIVARQSDGGIAGTADSYTVNLGVRGLTAVDLGVGLRSTSYANDRDEGRLHAAHIEMTPHRRLYLDLHGGTRTETPKDGPEVSGDLVWYGIDVEVDIVRSIFFLLALERNVGDLQEFEQLYLSLSYRF